ncbi:MAG: translation elongation factor-like protein [Parcubacteria bacterium 33_209]|jgi:putative protease|uniref:Translation elongation factor-like protein n=1 Tax=candidate division TA06 bacterium 34_109 TaxID=1635277 RepID=A0A124FZY9_UNCT6|nr:MAG: translation elongation factor-like protein [Parcubacteria bacterium 33_209]KUK85826.1 MAG: translation elongation factor-like protein [candidate division TA06 bacterium 34_109]
MEKVLIGHVIDYFAKIEVAAIDIDSGEIKVGDKLYFSGHTTDFEQEIESMQIDKRQVNLAKAGDSVGIKVEERVRDGDEVYKIID